MAELQEFFARLVYDNSLIIPLGFVFGSRNGVDGEPCGFAMLPAYLGLHLGSRNLNAVATAGASSSDSAAASASVPSQISLLQVDAEGEKRQIRELQRVRRSRDSRDVSVKLRALEQAARGSTNLMPPLLEPVKAYATLGEMMGVFREVFGEYQPSWGF